MDEQINITASNNGDTAWAFPFLLVHLYIKTTE